jgi:hypothetical protein
MKIRALLIAALVLTACAQAPVASEAPPPAAEPPPVADTRVEPAMCKDPRPEACTAHYDPVCATRDTGIRCVTTPCPSTELKTMGNACSACSDPKVYSYVKGECPAN